MSGPLAGIRVLDIGTLIAAPFGASLLADFGAEVIKVELPGEGDTMRQIGRFHDGVGLAFAVDGRNKKCITLDVRTQEGRDLFLRLVAKADALMENFTPGTLENWQLGEDVLRAANPGLILVRISGYGQYGPFSRRPSVDRATLAYSGLTYITGFEDAPPVRPGLAVADYATGVYNALSVMMALYHRDVHQGEGQTIDLALYEVAFRMSRDMLAIHDLKGEVRERTGNTNPNTSPGDAFAMKDGRWAVIVAASQKSWRNLARAMNRSDLIEDPRFRRNNDRCENMAPLHAIIREWVANFQWDELRQVLDKHGVPGSLMCSAADIAADEHYWARETLVDVPHPKLGRLRMPGVTPKMSKTPGEIRHAGLPMGSHNEEVYTSLLGLSTEDIEGLRTRGVI